MADWRDLAAYAAVATWWAAIFGAWLCAWGCRTQLIRIAQALERDECDCREARDRCARLAEEGGQLELATQIRSLG